LTCRRILCELSEAPFWLSTMAQTTRAVQAEAVGIESAWERVRRVTLLYGHCGSVEGMAGWEDVGASARVISVVVSSLFTVSLHIDTYIQI